MKELMLDDLRIDVTLGAGRVRMDLLGTARLHDAAAQIQPFFERIVRDARSAHAGLEVHFERLQFCNSITLAAVVRFVRRALDQSLQLEVVFEPRLRWQQVLADTLAMFDPKDGRFRLLPLAEATPPSVR